MRNERQIRACYAPPLCLCFSIRAAVQCSSCTAPHKFDLSSRRSLSSRRDLLLSRDRWIIMDYHGVFTQRREYKILDVQPSERHQVAWGHSSTIILTESCPVPNTSLSSKLIKPGEPCSRQFSRLLQGPNAFRCTPHSRTRVHAAIMRREWADWVHGSPGGYNHMLHLKSYGIRLHHRPEAGPHC